jgi:hypothetical protein
VQPVEADRLDQMVVEAGFAGAREREPDQRKFNNDALPIFSGRHEGEANRGVKRRTKESAPTREWLQGSVA